MKERPAGSKKSLASGDESQVPSGSASGALAKPNAFGEKVSPQEAVVGPPGFEPRSMAPQATILSELYYGPEKLESVELKIRLSDRGIP